VAPKTKRQTRRVLLAVPLVISGKIGGSAVRVLAETVDVSREGAKVRLTTPLEVESQIRVAALNPYRYTRARVVWARPQSNEYGIQLLTPQNFWGIAFPPDDWGEPPLVLSRYRPHVEPALGSSTAASRAPTRTLAEAPAGTAPPLPVAGATVTLSGMSAIRMPFQESGLLVPTGPGVASMLVRPSVDSGTPLRLIVADQVFRARITSVSKRREQGKWRVWLRFV